MLPLPPHPHRRMVWPREDFDFAANSALVEWGCRLGTEDAEVHMIGGEFDFDPLALRSETDLKGVAGLLLDRVDDPSCSQMLREIEEASHPAQQGRLVLLNGCEDSCRPKGGAAFLGDHLMDFMQAGIRLAH